MKNVFFHNDIKKRSIWSRPQALLILLDMFVVFVVLCMVSSRLLVFGLRSSMSLFLLLISSISFVNLPYSFISLIGAGPFYTLRGRYIMGDDPTHIQSIKMTLYQLFQMKDYSPLCYYMGIEVSYDPHGISYLDKSILSILSLELRSPIMLQLTLPCTFITSSHLIWASSW